MALAHKADVEHIHDASDVLGIEQAVRDSDLIIIEDEVLFTSSNKSAFAVGQVIPRGMYVGSLAYSETSCTFYLGNNNGHGVTGGSSSSSAYQIRSGSFDEPKFFIVVVDQPFELASHNQSSSNAITGAAEVGTSAKVELRLKRIFV